MSNKNGFALLRFFLLLITLITAFLFFIPHRPPIQAYTIENQEISNTTYTLEDFNYDADQEFLGVLVDRTFNIALPSNWQFESEALLTIHFSHSSALDPISSMSVNWNGQRVGSTLLTGDTADNGTLQISLSPENINSGYNALQIQFFMGISEDFCIDYDNPAVWAVVHKSTSLKLSYQEVAAGPELSNAPNILIDSSLIAENNITMIVPDQLDLPTLNAVAVTATRLGQLANWRNAAINVMTLSEAAQNHPLGNLVIFAPIDQITSLNASLSATITTALQNYTNGGSDRLPLSQNDGIISFQISPFDPSAHVLCLSGTNTAAVVKSARAVTMEEFFSQSEGQWAIVRTIPDPQGHPASSRLSVSMQDLGLNDTTAYGTREQTVQFSFPLSALWDIDSEAWLELYFSHSELLNVDRSTLTVFINGIPVTSIKLTSKTADQGYREVRIPLRFLKVGDNTISFEANMEYADSREETKLFCTDDTYPRAWLTLHAHTAIVFPEAPDDVTLSLSSFPYGFANPYTYENFAFVIPENDRNIGINTLANLALTLGKSSQGSASELEVLFNDDDSKNYLISIGTIPALLSDTLNNALPLPLDRSTGLPQANDLVLEMDTPSGIRGYIQSFQEGNQINLVVTAMTQKGLIAAGNLLSKASTRAGLNGTIAIISDSENASVYQIGPESSISAGDIADDKPPIVDIGSQSIWIVRISIGVAVISIIGLVIALVWKNKQSREI